MLATTCVPNVTASVCVSQNESCVSDLEVLRRVAEIRSSWTIDERVRRRQEANRRLTNLIESLRLNSAA
jgi:hypothetical protein